MILCHLHELIIFTKTLVFILRGKNNTNSQYLVQADGVQ